ncbi:ImmA/IrrE family metallo-endopeptidase [Flagellimonas allohymeniacidonis]|uniref:ImmA/IrrE family metallo-endopeptidase n=1 Tax=Flagellimonas allohymeniacidonis TaxID=2517819 RepID=A0A4V2HSG1_9FLAO|nr:ImmA/IrrE family metallo-endopeptidase [Allomuricauda hymeniacidonis]TAI47630.1 ImmA/IrrE family metallo-endopeptidase [Allomuricauda hymeniacidonis]
MDKELYSDYKFFSVAKSGNIDDAESPTKGTDFLNEYLEKSGFGIFVNRENQSIKKPIPKKTPFEESIEWKHPSVLKLVNEEGSGLTDPIEIIREKSRKMVLEALTNGWHGPPFDVIKLAKMNGYEVHPNESVAEARIIPASNTFKIEYNPFQSPARINFSIAHEIAHTLFSDCGDTIRYRKNELEKGSWQLEFLCNIAASELLLPYAEFTNTANEVDLDIKSLIDIARKYRASVESVFLRFSQVVEKPCTIAICTFNPDNQLVVNYSKNSLNAHLEIPKGYIIPENSNVYDCVKAGFTSYGLENWGLFGETRYAIHGVGLSPIKKQTQARVGILIVPEYFDPKPKKGIYIVYGDATSPRGKGNKIIAQVVNSSGGVGFGFGRAMAEKYPLSKKALHGWKKEKESFYLGNYQSVKIEDDLFVFQMLAQKGLYPKNDVIPLKYDKLRDGLIALREFSKSINASIHMPAIGAGQAGGDWNIIKGMIYDELITHGIDVIIYLLPGKNAQPNKSRTLTLFKKYEE